MKALFRILKLAGAVLAGAGAIKEHLDSLIEFLTFFVKNTHAEAYAWLKAHPLVRPLYDRLTAEQKAACDVAGPIVLEWLDAALPEEPVLDFLRKVKEALE